MLGNKKQKKTAVKFQYNNMILKLIAFAFTCVGTYGIAILQNSIMGIDSYSAQTLLAAFNADAAVFGQATSVLLCSGVCAFSIPIYAKILIEGYKNTSSVKNYLIGILILAIASEIPYDLAIGASFFDMTSQNPAFGMVIALVMLWIFKIFDEITGAKAVILKLVIIASAMLWTFLLGVNYGPGFVLLVAVLWLLEGKGIITIIAGILASMVYFPAPIGFVFNHFYNGEKGDGKREWFYVLYPVHFLIFGIISMYVL